MSERSKSKNVSAIILAAGKGTRMKSDKAKVLHLLAGRPLVLYVLDACVPIVDNTVVVVGIQAADVKSVISSHVAVDFAHQSQQLGTGHAVLCAMPELPDSARHILILCGDVPLITPYTLEQLIAEHIRSKNEVTVLGAKINNPEGYGRIKQRNDGTVECIVEESDATPAEKVINTVNTGIYCVERQFLEKALAGISTDNAQAEMYLTDIVGIAVDEGRRAGLVICRDNREMVGVNSLEDLKRAETLIASK